MVRNRHPGMTIELSCSKRGPARVYGAAWEPEYGRAETLSRPEVHRLAGSRFARQHMGWFVRPCRELRGIPSGGIVVTRILLLTLATLVGVAGASAQQRQITGQVTSAATREAVAGVNVSVTGPATLVFRRIAFKRREVQVPANQTTADATLEPDVFNLEAVVVTGQATGVERRNAA